jgi:hypothetical protein
MADIGIPAGLLQRYFTAYGTQSPLEDAITPEKVQNAIAAIGQYQDTRKAAANQKLLQASKPEGYEGVPISSFSDLMALKKLEAEQEKKGQEYFNKQSEKVFKWKEERAKKIEEQEKAQKEWLFKERKQAETEKHNRAMEAKKPSGKPDIFPEPPTGAGGGKTAADVLNKFGL